MRKRLIKLGQATLLICTALYLPQASALSPTPFSIQNLNPFILVYGLPSTEPAELKGANETASAVNLDLVNNSIIRTEGNEAISLDGETYRLAYTYRRGLSNDIEIGMEVPVIAHNPGFMDNFIEGWHDTFGLTNSERNKTPSNSLNYSYSVNNTNIITIDSPNEGLGDIRFYAAKQLFRDGDSALSLHAGIKLPTGDANKLHGSGATDLSVSLAHIKRHWLTSLNLSTFANGGLLVLGDGDVLSNIQEDVALFGSAGIIWDDVQFIDLKAQIDAHSSIYDSQLAQLGTDTIQLTVGGSLHFSPVMRMDIGVGENLFTDTTPDFIINLVIKNNY